jgi:hypothetical protein
VRPPTEAERARALSQRFGKRNDELEHCFDRFAADLEGQPKITIDFEVQTSGRVQSANVNPAALRQTSLGRCLAEVARGTEFESQTKLQRFSIPVQARAVRQ